jgi:hypothetical protein
MNVFLVVHLLDYLTAEAFKDFVIGPYLDPLEDVDDIDTVWLLWPPHHLVMWSSERHEWMNLMFDAMNPDEVSARQQRHIALPVLLEAEQDFFPHRPHRPFALLLRGDLRGAQRLRVLVAAVRRTA